MKLSAVVITYNEERNIGRCLDSLLPVADEIVVLDSNSTDQTVAIAESRGAKVYLQSFLGYVEQKNRALELASHDLVLSLDADEALDEKLTQSILAAKQESPGSAYSMNRCTWYCDRFIKHGSWYPDRKIRLFNKTQARWAGDNPHDHIVVDAGIPVKHLAGDILHYSYYSIEEHVAQNNKFSTISADALVKRNKKATAAGLVFRPFWAFLKGYFFKAGFLDGFHGFVVAVNSAHLTFLKYAKLYRKQNENAASS